jgi:hypothetical protein
MSNSPSATTLDHVAGVVKCNVANVLAGVQNPWRNDPTSYSPETTQAMTASLDFLPLSGNSLTAFGRISILFESGIRHSIDFRT